MERTAETSPIKKTASLLLSGWGYNLYREENQLRADDLLIRSKASLILSRARHHLSQLNAEYRRAQLPPPTRDNPIPDRQKLEQARMIEKCGALIEPITVSIQTAPVPSNDAVWRRHRSELRTLEILQTIDIRLIDAAMEFHDFVVDLNLQAVSMEALEQQVKTWLRPLQLVVQERAERLTLMI